MERILKDRITKLTIEKLKVENIHNIKLTFLICFTIICIFLVMGIAFGKIGLQNLYYFLIVLFVSYILIITYSIE